MIARPDTVTAPLEHPGRSLETKLRAAERRRKLNAFALVAPLFLFIVVVFVLPILSILYFSVDDPKLPLILPRTHEVVARWDGATLPDEAAYEALVTDLKDAYEAKTAAVIGMRLNYEISGFRSMVMRTARRAKRIEEPPYQAALIGLDERWGHIEHWRAIKASSGPFTTRYLLAAVDLERHWDGSVGRAPPERTIYISYLKRTFWISFWVLVYCIAIGYPMAYLIATTTRRLSRILLILVLLPFWTSLLVRTAAWVVLLQTEGIINTMLITAGITSEPLSLIFNRIGGLRGDGAHPAAVPRAATLRGDAQHPGRSDARGRIARRQTGVRVLVGVSAAGPCLASPPDACWCTYSPSASTSHRLLSAGPPIRCWAT